MPNTSTQLIIKTIVLIVTTMGCSVKTPLANTPKATVIYADKPFQNPIDTCLWHIEMDSLPNSSVTVKDGVLDMDTKGGVTVWLKKELTGSYQIEFTRKVIVDNGPNDRLSDMNFFWMATDPRNSNLFTRKGKFEEYDSLLLYYVGIGGNTNTTTRLRRYNGNGERLLLSEKNQCLLKPNHDYHIKIQVNNGVSSIWLDGDCLFTYTDKAPLAHGYFGFRSTWSHQQISHLKIRQIAPNNH
jgi:hypothetical protein